MNCDKFFCLFILAKENRFTTMTEDIAKKYKCGFLDCTSACKYRQQMPRHRKLKEHFIEPVRKVICDDEEDRKFVCAKCNKKFSAKTNAYRHFKTCKVKEKKIFECYICNKICPSQSKLTRHLNVHSIKKFHCTECCRCYKTADALGKHVCNQKIIDRLTNNNISEYDLVNFPPASFLINNNLNKPGVLTYGVEEESNLNNLYGINDSLTSVADLTADKRDSDGFEYGTEDNDHRFYIICSDSVDANDVQERETGDAEDGGRRETDYAADVPDTIDRDDDQEGSTVDKVHRSTDFRRREKTMRNSIDNICNELSVRKSSIVVDKILSDTWRNAGRKGRSSTGYLRKSTI